MTVCFVVTAAFYQLILVLHQIRILLSQNLEYSSSDKRKNIILSPVSGLEAELQRCQGLSKDLQSSIK